jgi:hypothetical protein
VHYNLEQLSCRTHFSFANSFAAAAAAIYDETVALNQFQVSLKNSQILSPNKSYQDNLQ